MLQNLQLLTGVSNSIATAALIHIMWTVNQHIRTERHRVRSGSLYCSTLNFLEGPSYLKWDSVEDSLRQCGTDLSVSILSTRNFKDIRGILYFKHVHMQTQQTWHKNGGNILHMTNIQKELCPGLANAGAHQLQESVQLLSIHLYVIHQPGGVSA